MLEKSRYLLTSTLLVLVIVINTSMRYFDQQAFVYGNIVSLTILSITIILISRGMNKSLGNLLLGYFISLFIDKAGFVPYEIGANDILFLTGWFVATYDYHRRNSTTAVFDINSIILLLALLVKVYSQNSLVVIGERYVFYIGDSITYFLLAAYITRMLVKRYQFLPLLLLAATVNNLIDNLIGDPYEFHLNELYFMVWVLIGLLWWECRKRFAHTRQAKRQFDAPFLAFNILVVGYVVVEILRYTFLF